MRPLAGECWSSLLPPRSGTLASSSCPAAKSRTIDLLQETAIGSGWPAPIRGGRRGRREPSPIPARPHGVDTTGLSTRRQRRKRRAQRRGPTRSLPSSRSFGSPTERRAQRRIRGRAATSVLPRFIRVLPRERTVRLPDTHRSFQVPSNSICAPTSGDYSRQLTRWRSPAAREARCQVQRLVMPRRGKCCRASVHRLSVGRSPAVDRQRHP